MMGGGNMQQLARQAQKLQQQMTKMQEEIEAREFEATAGGSALKGEDADRCARRELREETGIDAGALTNIGHFVSHNTIYGIFLCVTDCDKNAVKLQEGETVSYKWISEAEFIDFVNSDAMIDVQYQRYLPYLKKMGYVK